MSEPPGPKRQAQKTPSRLRHEVHNAVIDDEGAGNEASVEVYGSDTIVPETQFDQLHTTQADTLDGTVIPGTQSADPHANLASGIDPSRPDDDQGLTPPSPTTSRLQPVKNSKVHDHMFEFAPFSRPKSPSPSGAGFSWQLARPVSHSQPPQKGTGSSKIVPGPISSSAPVIRADAGEY